MSGGGRGEEGEGVNTNCWFSFSRHQKTPSPGDDKNLGGLASFDFRIL